jgi:crotonobetainyl-CoA:carnitine CoA-transferase CaiB-like acyl-CoA transferase
MTDPTTPSAPADEQPDQEVNGMTDVPGTGPLAGITVLDFGRVIAGPFVAQILADLGADVIKVERPLVGDETRSYGATERSSLFETLNRNKRSIALDLSNADTGQILTALIERADVVVHNFRPGVMERLGLAHTDVWKVNPRIVYCAISGFGSGGPLRDKAANDVIAQAYSGLMSFTGDADGPPVRVPVPVADYTAGLFAVAGVLAALLERATTGRGRLVETSLIEGMLALECMHLGDYLTTGQLPVRLASGNMLGQPNQAFRTRDGAAVIAAVNDDMWRRCATVLGGSELAEDPRYRHGSDRLARKDELAAVIEGFTRRLDTEELVARLDAAGVVCSAINTLADVAGDPQVRALGILQSASQDDAPNQVASPLTIDGARPAIRRTAPTLSADAEQILNDLGLGREDVAALRAAGAVSVSAPELVAAAEGDAR